MLRARRADFPILLSFQYFVKPALLDDQRTVCAAFQAVSLARPSLRFSCRRVAFIAEHAVSTLIAEHAASTLVVDHATASAKALTLRAVGVAGFQEAFAAQLGARALGARAAPLGAAAQRGASHVCNDWLSSALRLFCLRVSSTAVPFLDCVYSRLFHCGVAPIAEHAASTLISEYAASTHVADDGSAAAKVVALQAVGVGVLEEAFAAELGSRRCGLFAAAERGASHVCSDSLSSGVYGTTLGLMILAGRKG